MPLSLGFIAWLASRFVKRLGAPPSIPRSAGAVLPMMMSVPLTLTPGAISPSSSSLSYVPWRRPVHVSTLGTSKISWPDGPPGPASAAAPFARSWSACVL